MRAEIDERIAAGGMAHVFRGTVSGHGVARAVAVKRIDPRFSHDPRFRAGLLAEARLQARLRHPNVVGVMDVGSDGNDLYLTMEYVDGPSLDMLLRRCRTAGVLLPVRLAALIGIELLRGLDAIHRAGVVHRDVSPSNVLVSRLGEVKICDFGVARALGVPEPGGVADHFVGKSAYVSPEQLQGAPGDARSDLFSACVVIFECLTGRPLFAGRSTDEVRAKVAHMPIPRASSLRREVPRALARSLAHGLRREPERRPASVAALLDEILDELRARRLLTMPLELERFLGAMDAAAASALMDPIRETEPAKPDELPTRVRSPRGAGLRLGAALFPALLSWLIFELAANVLR